MGSAERPGWLEGIAEARDAAGLRGRDEGAEDCGEEVGVLMRIDVGYVEAGALQAANLSTGFGDDLGGADATGSEGAHKRAE